MNYLAHLFLSGEDQDILVGNFICDGIRGNHISSFKPKVQEGILLHRFIDNYTDNHPIWKKSKELLWERHRHYGAVLTDIFYDHFLAKKWEDHHHETLRDYTLRIYGSLTERKSEMPERMLHFLRYMKQYDWLYNYKEIDGIAQVLGGMSRRAKGKNRMDKGTRDLLENYTRFEDHFDAFFPELKKAVKDELNSKQENKVA